MTVHSIHALTYLLRGPCPRQEFNPGVVDRLSREGLVTFGTMPSPYKSRPGTVPSMTITDAGRHALQEDASR